MCGIISVGTRVLYRWKFEFTLVGCIFMVILPTNVLDSNQLGGLRIESINRDIGVILQLFKKEYIDISPLQLILLTVPPRFFGFVSLDWASSRTIPKGKIFKEKCGVTAQEIFRAPATTNQTQLSSFIVPEIRKNGLAPFFDEITSREIEAIEGRTVIIPCTIRSLSREKVVSWIRTKDLHILTSGTHTFSSDYRFEPVHGDRNEDFWGLRIRGVKAEDTGQYECQVNTEPKMSLALKLTVNTIGEDDSSKWLGYAKIKEPKELFVQHGSSFFIRCEITPIFRQNINYDVWWLHEDTQISFQTKESRISIQTSYNKDKNILHSILSFDYITWQDGGRYTCLQPSVKQDSVKVIIVEAESSEAMQRDYPLSSRSTTTYNRLLYINIVLILSTKLLSIILY